MYGRRDGSLQVQIRWMAGCGPPCLTAELPTQSGATGPWLDVLARFAALKATGQLGDRVSLDPRSHRLLMIMRVLDASLAGGTQRDIAAMLVGPERMEADWRHPGQHLRDRVRRAVSRGHTLMNGGYLSLLR
jgi:hypothetical protein